ncbi:MAG: glycosyltransferase family 4 protein [Chloroflexaceae bacterium]|nr:glycosyltransferase family 4 protein [Chloroflexaceae bacterium]
MTWFTRQGVAPLMLSQTYLPDTSPRATIVVAICLVRDAVGNHVAAMLHSLRAAGYRTLLMVEHSDPRQTEEVRRSTMAVRLADLKYPTPQSQRAADHFFSSDVVIVVYPLYYELADLIKLARHSAVIFDYHSVTPPELWGPEQPGYTNLIIGQQRVDLVQYADYAIARSRFTGDELVRTGLIPPDRVVVTPLGSVTPSDPVRCEPDPSLVARYKPHGERVLLYVGRMARNKRLIDLVEALALVRQQVPNTILLLVGDNTFPLYRAYADEILARAANWGAASRSSSPVRCQTWSRTTACAICW